MPRLLPLALLLLLCAFEVEAQGTKLQDVPARCPVCKTSFIAYAVVDTGLDGGMDADFFWRSKGEVAENYGVWMCPECYFTATPTDFENELKEDQRKMLEQHLPAIRATRPESMEQPHPDSQRKIPAWFKWKVALACYELRKDTLQNSEAYLGDVCLRGSWVTRVSANPVGGLKSWAEDYKDVTMAFNMRHKNVLDLLDHASLHVWFHTRGELMSDDLARSPDQKLFTAAERPVALFLAGAYFRESGDLVRARVFLDQVLQGTKPEQKEQLALAQRELDLLKLEREFQTAAVDHFRKVYESGSVKGTVREPPCVYLIGELNRRLGNIEEARTWFERVEAIHDVPQDLLGIVARQKKLLN